MRAINGKLFLFYIALVLFGYSLAAPIAEFFPVGGGNLTVTLQYRIVTTGAAIVFIFKSIFIDKKTHLDRSGKQGFFLLLVFWFIVTCRLFYDAIFQGNALGEDTLSEYIIMGYALVFIPLISLARPYNETDLSYIFQIGFYILLLGVLLSLLLAIFAVLNGNSLGSPRLSLEHLNPISLGKYSAMLFILSFGLRTINRKQTLLLNIGMTVGLLGVILSGSRGAFVSSAAVLFFIMSTRFNLKTVFGFSIFFLIIAWVSEWWMSILVPDFDLFSNYLAMGSDLDQSAQIRFQLYEGALQQFYNSPILGDLIVEREWKFYPHNHLLEILMATGIVGLGIFLMFNITVIYKLRRILKGFKIQSAMASILAYLLIYAITSGFFSGSIVSSGEYWLLSTLILFTSFDKARYMK